LPTSDTHDNVLLHMDANNGSQFVYSVNEAAKLLGVNRVTISRLISKGELPASRLGHRTVRIKHEDLIAFLKSREVPRPERQENTDGEAQR
jgi:excisionase family DNA binding protein